VPETSAPSVYLPTTNVFLTNHAPATSYQEQVHFVEPALPTYQEPHHFLAPVQPASPVFTTVTEGLPDYRHVSSEPAVSFHTELPTAQQFVHTTQNGFASVGGDDLSAPNYQVPTAVVHQVPQVATYQSQVPAVVTTSHPIQTVTVHQTAEPFPASGYSSEFPVQPSQDLPLPVYSKPTTASQNVFLQRVPARSEIFFVFGSATNCIPFLGPPFFLSSFWVHHRVK
jgi:hypothetical protein